jgi:hypothetical protein
MNLFSIARKLWRHKLVALPIVLLILCGVVYVVAVKQPVYEASSSYILINPPAPPTPADIERDPALGRLNSDNPYTRFTDESVMVDVLASSMMSESARRALVRAGADSRYMVTPSSGSTSGFTKPIVQITAQGWSPEAAMRSAKLVGNALTGELARMQQVEGVDPGYRIRAQLVDPPDSAKVQASAQLRPLIGVLVLGVVLLLGVVVVADAMVTLRTGRIGQMAPSAPAANGEPWSAARVDGLSDNAPGDWPEFNNDPLHGGDLVELFPDPDAMAPASTDAPRTRQLRYGNRRDRSN